MKSNLPEHAATDRCATDGEIREAGAAQRIISLDASFDGSLEASFESSNEMLARGDTYCEMRAETGEWVQMHLFELEFIAALDDAKKREPSSN
ncbi:MAG: hypothetical protein WBF06_14900 [Candidatus Acidiferrales bacterium]